MAGKVGKSLGVVLDVGVGGMCMDTACVLINIKNCN